MSEQHSKRRSASTPPTEGAGLPHEHEEILLLFQVLEAVSRYQQTANGEPAVMILVPKGKLDAVRNLDVESIVRQSDLPVLQELSLQEIAQISELWRQLVQRVPIQESEELYHIVIVTLSMDIVSRLHERYAHLGLPEIVTRRGVPFEQLRISSLYSQILVQLFVLDVFTELVSRAPKLVIPTSGVSVPPGNA